MDEWLVAAGVAVVLTLALAGAVWFLVARCLRNRRSRTATTHVFRGQGQAVTVAELLEEAAERGEPVRLNWPEDDLKEAGRMKPFVQDNFPTAILPKIEISTIKTSCTRRRSRNREATPKRACVRSEHERQENGS